MRKDATFAKTLENQLEHTNVKYSKLQSENKILRQQIDVMRKEKKNQDRVNKGYSSDIKFTNDKGKKLNSATYQGQRASEETHNQILALKAKHETEKDTFEKKIKDLQDKLKERDDTDLDKTKSKGTGPAITDTTQAQAGEFSNPVAFLNLRLTKWK